jgi:hypothetical protein
MPKEPKAIDSRVVAYVLPWYLRYARRLALLSGAAVGVATGVAVVSSSGCGNTCAGTPCGHQITGAGGFIFTGVPPAPFDASVGGNDGAASSDAIVDAGSDDTGGGPRPAPVLPAAWMA